jgi:hypothetical protein
MATYTARVALTDASGNGTGTTRIPVNGMLMSVSVTYDSSSTPTSVTLAEVGGGARVLLNLTPANTNVATYRPQFPVSGANGSAIVDMYTWEYLEGRPLVLTVAGAQANKANAVTVTIITS